MSKHFKPKAQDRRYIRDVDEYYKPYFQIKAVYFTDGSKTAFVERQQYQMDAPAKEVNEVMMVSAQDVAKIYAPGMQLEIQGDTISIQYQGKKALLKVGSRELQTQDQTLEMEQAPLLLEGRVYLDVEAVMGKAFGKYTIWDNTYLAPGDYLGIGESPEDLFQNPNIVKDMIIAGPKKTGILRRAYYFEEGQAIMPYNLYVPTTYNPEEPTKLVIYLHGAGGSCTEDRDLNRVPLAIETASEKLGAITLFAEGYSQGFYGGANPDLHPELMNLSDKEKHYIKLCELEVLAVLKQVTEAYNIDERNIFLYGNSMGGGGTFWLAMHYPIFRAIAPCGAMTTNDMNSFDLSKMKGLPALFVCGTENIGYDQLPLNVACLREHGVDATLRTVAGGIHASAWAYAVGDIYNFFAGHAAQ